MVIHHWWMTDHEIVWDFSTIWLIAILSILTYLTILTYLCCPGRWWMTDRESVWDPSTIFPPGILSILTYLMYLTILTYLANSINYRLMLGCQFLTQCALKVNFQDKQRFRNTLLSPSASPSPMVNDRPWKCVRPFNDISLRNVSLQFFQFSHILCILQFLNIWQILVVKNL